MNTKQIMEIALKLAGLEEVPEDSGIIVEGENIKKVAVGVDMEAAEILIAREIGADLVISHHPAAGLPRINLHKVMENQIDRMVEAGVPINKAQKALKEAMEDVEALLHASNYERAASAAKLLGMPFMAIHTPADIISEKTVQEHLDKRLKDKPRAKVKDVIDVLKELPEYQNAETQPLVRVGSKDSFAGKVFVTMAGGMGGGKEVAKAYFEAGVGTLIVMHMAKEVVKELKKQNIGNVIVAGHMASDSVGLNKIISKLEEEGLEVIRMSGIINPQKNS